MKTPPTQHRVTIAIPAKDEAVAIRRTLRSLPIQTLEAEGWTVDVVVLDGRSTDGTDSIARRHGARVVADEGQGKGRALRGARRHLEGDYIVMLDADGSYAADAIPAVVRLLADGLADIVMGNRRPRPGAMTALHRVGNAMLSLEASILYGRPCKDVCTGLWGFTRSALHAMPLQAEGFELEAELFSLASRMGLGVTSIDVDYLPRDGETKLSAGRDGLRIGWCLLRTRFRRLDEQGAPAPEDA